MDMKKPNLNQKAPSEPSQIPAKAANAPAEDTAMALGGNLAKPVEDAGLGSVLQTSPMKTREGWREQGGSLTTYLEVGDLVDEDLKYYFIEVLPPVTMNSSLVQMGEPYDFCNGRSTYLTLHKTPEGWRYAGTCHRGEFTNPDAPQEAPSLVEAMKGLLAADAAQRQACMTVSGDLAASVAADEVLRKAFKTAFAAYQQHGNDAPPQCRAAMVAIMEAEKDHSRAWLNGNNSASVEATIKSREALNAARSALAVEAPDLPAAPGPFAGEIEALVASLEARGINPEDLDELIYDLAYAMAEEDETTDNNASVDASGEPDGVLCAWEGRASEVNNGGLGAQVKFLYDLYDHLSAEEQKAHVEQAINEHLADEA